MHSNHIEEQVYRYQSDFRGKLRQMEKVLGSYMDEAKHEFLVKPSHYRTKAEVENNEKLVMD